MISNGRKGGLLASGQANEKLVAGRHGPSRQLQAGIADMDPQERMIKGNVACSVAGPCQRCCASGTPAPQGLHTQAPDTCPQGSS